MAYSVLEQANPDIFLNAFTKENTILVMVLLLVVIAALIYPIDDGYVSEKSTNHNMEDIIDCMTVSKGYIGRRHVKDITYVRKLHSLVYAQSLHPVWESFGFNILAEYYKNL